MQLTIDKFLFQTALIDSDKYIWKFLTKDQAWGILHYTNLKVSALHYESMDGINTLIDSSIDSEEDFKEAVKEGRQLAIGVGLIVVTHE